MRNPHVGKLELGEFRDLGVRISRGKKENAIELTMPDYADKLR